MSKMRVKRLDGTEYATALKEAISKRRAGTIDMQTDDMLGNCIYSIANWAISEQYKDGKLWYTTIQDEDFRSHVVCKVAEAVNKVDLSREPKEILSYLLRVGKTDGCCHFVRDSTSQKRTGEIVDLQDADVKADFYGEAKTFRNAI